MNSPIMDEHRKFLADRLLSEGQPISYRGLSKSLDVHVNRAKGMLFDFHRFQNGHLLGSIHATYLVSGIIAANNGLSNGTEMNSASNQPEESLRIIGNKQLTLVGEENLGGLPRLCYPSFRLEFNSDQWEDVLGNYRSITSIHVYGLSPTSMKDFWFSEGSFTTNDHMVDDRKRCGFRSSHGAVCNPYMRLRDGKSQLNSGHSQTLKQENEQASHIKKRTIKPPSQSKQQPGSQRMEMVNESNRAHNPILQSFSKTSSRTLTKSTKRMKQNDEVTAALSDDGEPDDFDILPSNKPNPDSRTNQDSRKDREDYLRRMMEEEEENKEEEDRQVELVESAQDIEMKESPESKNSPDSRLEPEILSAQTDNDPPEALSSVGDGRRRGKRRVLVKKRILDDQGYMVTIQEPGWESFSEDDMTRPTNKPTPPPMQSSSSSAKVRKTSTKGSQGSIMSFFAKK
ncbi:DNA polymerase subunit Cdc27 [Metarhizium rileyi]|uniref:DNA polymerase delta subunit 3 n=1 Tax=Metarhizium rileyi (strain RCEF 4871) TaxID=1649241 RepID=A0A167G8I9_METRR|nr:DNA polymerase subunit Cdc27 [Metarhizium rileyi RCEF 4871]TWU78909.1 hypothetical protein ED733_007870 [Metarhizium rileyi]